MLILEYHLRQLAVAVFFRILPYLELCFNRSDASVTSQDPWPAGY